MAEKKNYITPSGLKKLADELHRLKSVDRPKVVDEVAAAAALGDRSENAEYIYGKKKLREIDRRLGWLIGRIDDAVVVDPREQKQNQRVFFGATVKVEDDEGDEKIYVLVGEDETDAPRGRISWRSPIGSALLKKALDDEVRVQTPGGVKTLTIIEIRYE